MLYSMEFIDQLNRQVNLPKTPQRIISLVPSQTELLVDLGLRNSIVGITKFCVHPKGLKKENAIVGGTKKVNFAKIKSLQPEIIICNKEENTEAMVRELERIAPVWVSDVETIEDSLKLIELLGEIFVVPKSASEIILKIELELRAFREFILFKKPKNVLYLIWKDPFMAAGKKTFIDSLLKVNNFKNIVSKPFDRYPEIEETIMAKADLILLSTEPYPFKESDVVLLENKFKTEVKLVDGEYFSWYGSRLIDAFQYFRTLHK
jgi:iron complex transport system substrate-binding protein